VTVLQQLVDLSREVAQPLRGLCIGAEGNAAAVTEAGRFLVKVTGASMADCAPADFVEVHSEPLITALHEPPRHESEVRIVLNASRVRSDDPPPSTESFVHAVLFQQDAVRFAVHTHPEEIVALASLDEADALAGVRLFPDHVVFCGPSTLYVPYAAPGLPLARDLEIRLDEFLLRWKCVPTVIFLQNHGLITCGATAKEAAIATYVATKAARALLSCLASGRSFRSMSPDEVAAISGWADEHERRRKLFGED
jgi:rhamnose utilization protein RhaD (predicted bifunctional aldolase and dehydrogenase)